MVAPLIDRRGHVGEADRTVVGAFVAFGAVDVIDAPARVVPLLHHVDIGAAARSTDLAAEEVGIGHEERPIDPCLLYPSDAADASLGLRLEGSRNNTTATAIASTHVIVALQKHNRYYNMESVRVVLV